MPKKKYPKSIIPHDSQYCRLCGSPYTEVHHVFGGPWRKKATADGLVTHFCRDHHRQLHESSAWRRYVVELKKTAELAWLEHFNGTIEEFTERYGHNYV